MPFCRRTRRSRHGREQLRHFSDWPRYEPLSRRIKRSWNGRPNGTPEGIWALGWTGGFSPPGLPPPAELGSSHERKNRPGQKEKGWKSKGVEEDEESWPRYIQPGEIDSARWMKPSPPPSPPSFRQQRFLPPKLEFPCPAHSARAERQKRSSQLTTASQRTASTPISGDVRSCDD